MAIFASLFGVLGRFLGRILNMALGWATTLLFGRVPQSKQYLVLGISLGSILTVVFVVGMLVPDVGTLLIAAVPRPDFIREEWIRLAMLAAALALPPLIGLAGYFLLDADERPRGKAFVVQLLRGYPYAFVLAATIVFMGVVALVRKARSVMKRWSDAHIPVVVKPGGYTKVARDLEEALDRARLGMDRRRAPRVLEVPSRLLATVAGPGVKRLVPDELVLLASDELEVLIYPSDIYVAGTGARMARARAAISSRLTFTAAYLTTGRESQAIEERLERVWSAAHGQPTTSGKDIPTPDSPGELEETAARGELHEAPSPSAGGADGPQAGDGTAPSPPRLSVPELDRLESDLREIDADLALLEVPYEDWEVLCRLRLEVERDVLERRRQLRDDRETSGRRDGEALRGEVRPVDAAATVELGLSVAERALAGTLLGRLAHLARRLIR